MHLIAWSVLVCLVSITFLNLVCAIPGTLAPPLPPTKIVAKAVSDRMRYYSFDERDDSNRGHSSDDPFEVPSLTDIAEIMRRRDSESQQGPRSEEQDGRDSWGWKPTRPPPTNKGWGWPQETTTWAPPPSQAPSYGWSSSKGDNRDSGYHSLGSYGSDRRKEDSGQYWSYGWQERTTTPKYNPKYLSSDEEKYKPIRYPSSSSIGFGTGHSGSDSGYGRPSSSLWSSASASQSGSYGKGAHSSSWPSSSQSSHGSSWSQSSAAWPSSSPSQKGYDTPYRRDSNEYRPSERKSESGENYPRSDHGSSWGQSSAFWPSSSSGQKDYDNPYRRDSNEYYSYRPETKSGWKSEENYPRPNPSPPSWPDRVDENEGWNRPPPTTEGFGWPEPTREPRPPSTTEGFGWPEPTRPPRTRPPPTTEGWSQESSAPYERPDYPPGIRPSPVDNTYNSNEDIGFPNQPNHYRIVSYTPSPEEQLEIARRPGVGGGWSDDNNVQDSYPSYSNAQGNNKGQGPPPFQGPPPSYGNNKGQGPPPPSGNYKGQGPPPFQGPPPSYGNNKGQGPPPPYGNNKGQGPPPFQRPPPSYGNNKGLPPRRNDKVVDEAGSGSNSDGKQEKWFVNNFHRIQSTTTRRPKPRTRVTVKIRRPQETTENPSQKNPPKKEKKYPEKKLSYDSDSRQIKSGNSEQNAVPHSINDKSSSKRTRFDEHGFKYIPYNDPHPMAKNLATSQRDIYDSLDYTNGGEKRDKGEKFADVSESRYYGQVPLAWKPYDPNNGPSNSRHDFGPLGFEERLESAASEVSEDKFSKSDACPLGMIYSIQYRQCMEPRNIKEQATTTMKSMITLFK